MFKPIYTKKKAPDTYIRLLVSTTKKKH